jgi:hypothetical protein
MTFVSLSPRPVKQNPKAVENWPIRKFCPAQLEESGLAGVICTVLDGPRALPALAGAAQLRSFCSSSCYLLNVHYTTDRND